MTNPHGAGSPEYPTPAEERKMDRLELEEIWSRNKQKKISDDLLKVNQPPKFDDTDEDDDDPKAMFGSGR
jgi:hypothetical protein